MNLQNFICSFQYRFSTIWVLMLLLFVVLGCSKQMNGEEQRTIKSAQELLGNPNYKAISYSAYRKITRDSTPSIDDIKEDLKLLSALGIKLIRTYDVAYPHSENVLEAIKELKLEDPDFEMYLMLGVWIDCENAWTDLPPNHEKESSNNAIEVVCAVELAKAYPNIIKIIAVGNEAMVKWAEAYYVQPGVILKWVNYLQSLKAKGELDKKLWITSSDNFASWGGGSEEYHVPELVALINAVDYISVHTYPMHDTHYNPDFWGLKKSEPGSSEEEKIQIVMNQALSYAQMQFASVAKYVKSLGIEKPIHIGETGWASSSDGFYGKEGSKACDEYKQAIYYDQMRAWTDSIGISCFIFEAFDEPWKDAENPFGSENHFGLFKVDGQAKYVLWDELDDGIFKGLSRGGNLIKKSFNGVRDSLMKTVSIPISIQKSND